MITNIVGIGKAGRSFAEYLPNLNKVQIDVPKARPEQLDQMDFASQHFCLVDGDILFVLCSSSDEASVSLRLLERLQQEGREITILCFFSEQLDLLSSSDRRMSKHISGVLQEVTRSGKFKEMILVDNAKMLNLISDANLLNMYDRINHTVAQVLLNLWHSQGEKPVLGSLTDPDPAARITTIGTADASARSEDLFYDLRHPREKEYTFRIGEKTIETEFSLQSSILEFLKSRKQFEEVGVSYAVFQSPYDENSLYTTHRTSVNQEEN